MFGKTTQKLFVTLVIVSLLLTGVGPSRGAAASQAAAPLVAPAAERAGTGVPAPQAPTPIDPSPYNQYLPRLAGDSAGNLFAVWEDYREGQTAHIRFAYRPAGGAWQISVKLDPSASRSQSSQSIAVDGSGNAYAVWLDQRSNTWQVYSAYRPAGGAWGAAQPVSPSGAWGQYRPGLAVNRRGEAVVVWWQGRSGGFILSAAVRPAGGPWGAAESVNPTVVNRFADIAVALDDWERAYALWTGGSASNEVLFASRATGGPWSATESIRDSRTGTAWAPSLATDSAGNLHAVWSDERNGNDDIYAAYRPAGGPWSADVRVNDDATGKAQYMPGLAVDGAGNVTALWTDDRGADSALYAATRSRGHGWGSNESLITWPGAASRGQPAEALAPDGPATMDTFMFAVQYVNDVLAVLAALPVPGMESIYNVVVEQFDALAGSGDGPYQDGNAAGAPALNSDQGAYPWAEPSFIDFWLPDLGTGTSSQPPNPDDLPSDLAWPGDVDTAMAILHEPYLQEAIYLTHCAGWNLSTDYLSGLTTVELGQIIRDAGAQVAEQMAEQQAAAQAEPAYLQEAYFMTQLAGWGLSMEYLKTLTPEELATIAQQAAAHPAYVPPDQGTTNQNVQQSVEAGEQVDLLDSLTSLSPWDILSLLQQGAMPGDLMAEAAAIATYLGIDPHQLPGEPVDLLELELGGTRSGTTDPVLPHSGEFVHTETPLRIPGRGLDYAFRLTYHSQLVYDGPAGWGWEHNYDRRVVTAGGGSLGMQDGAGRSAIYSFDGVKFTPSAGRYTAVVTSTAGITLTDRTGQVESYYPLDGSAAAGRLRSISDRNGNTLRFAYDASGRLQTVTDTLGRIITYSYDAHNRIAAVSDFSGRAVRLAYDAAGDLVSITTPAVIGTPNGNDFPQGKTTRFAYTSGFTDQRLNHNLTTIISPNEVADGSLTSRTVNTYGTSGLEFDRVVSQSWGGGRSNASGVPAGGAVTLAYSTAIEPTAPPGAFSKTTITDRGSNVLELWHDGAGHRLADRQVVGGQALVTDYTYNADGLLTRITYPAGNRVEYRYDDAATNRLAQGNLLELRRVPDAARGCDLVANVIARGGVCPEAISTHAGDCFVAKDAPRNDGAAVCVPLVTTYTYEPAFQKLKTLTDPRGATTTYAYDARGNLTQVTFPNVTLGPSAPQAASQSWTYNAFGQPLSYTDPEGNVTRYEYYATGPSTGYRQRVIRDSGGLNVTTAYTCDAVGNVTSVTDGRGIRTDYTVNALNQVVKVTRAATAPNTQSLIPNTAVPLGYETFYTYDANDNVVRVDVENVLPDLDANYHPTGSYSRDAANPWLTTSYTYDLLDNLVRQSAEVSPSLQAVTEYRYDPLERLISLTWPAGNRVEYAYDGRGQLRQVTRGAGTAEAATTNNDYDANGNLTRFTDGEGHPTDYVYDGFDRLTGRIDAMGNVSVWRYDANGNLVESLTRDGQDGRNPGRTLDAAGLVTLSQARFSYDERNRRYRQEQRFFTADVDTGTLTPLTVDGDGDGWVETAYTYDRSGNLTALTDDRGQTTRYAYDGLGRLSLRTDALNNTIAYAYDGDNNLVRTVATERQPDALAPAETFTTTYAYDAANRLVQTTDSLGQTDRSAYDSRGNRVFRSDANGPVVMSLRGAGLATKQSPSLQQAKIASQTPLAMTAAQTNDHGNTALFAYDGQNRLLAATYHLRVGDTGAGAVTDAVTMTYAYDANGNLARRADPNGNATAYAYDALDRLTRAVYADGTAMTYAYDRAGNLTRRTDPNGSVIATSYDSLNRRIRTDVTRGAGVGGTTLQTFAWDGLSRRITATDNNDPANPADDSALAFAYDSLSNVRRETQDGRVVSATYDGLGNRLTLTYPGGTALSYTYDALDRVKSIADGGGQLASYDYLGPWRVWRRTNGNGTFAAYTYDAGRRLTGLAYRLTSNQLLVTSFQYTYDRAGNRLTETSQPDNHQTVYAYDSLYRLTSAQAPASSFQYLYDPAGNRTQTTRNGQVTRYTANSVNEYLAVGSETRAYDANGNLRQVRKSISSGHRLYLPLLLKRPASSAAAAVAADASARGLAATATLTETVVSYRYDFSDRLIGLTRTMTITAEAGAQVTTTASSFTYDVFDRQAGTATPGGDRRFVYAGGRAIEERDGAGNVIASYVGLLTMDRGGTRAFYQTDGVGSVRALADATGAILEHVDYEPFGAPTFSGGGQESAVGNPFLFRGHRYAAGGSFYVYGGRRYEPDTGRYLQRGQEALGNPYTFAGNNPVRSADR